MSVKVYRHIYKKIKVVSKTMCREHLHKLKPLLKTPKLYKMQQVKQKQITKLAFENNNWIIYMQPIQTIVQVSILQTSLSTRNRRFLYRFSGFLSRQWLTKTWCYRNCSPISWWRHTILSRCLIRRLLFIFLLFIWLKIQTQTVFKELAYFFLQNS